MLTSANIRPENLIIVVTKIVIIYTLLKVKAMKKLTNPYNASKQK
ncbi:hypothetical protein XSR1_570020 [Xenorhabdus szentirmaii DSM 16338]|uniref:Uncharacterized protein n=1 Tax=Xenorhabdus szentirmaii DSM 16338 TaxID=1427518 RepID=W1J4F6_9GAMM|nr:hypothetical protein XSR1_570020 [Xenorhabdus szentirmaii DSM 16338]